ncbi:hypothetical protein M758_4G189000 [Ceratodon purpureus]|nr:hypothetical protein M758_4G189000 [Ceratodon purpureus]
MARKFQLTLESLNAISSSETSHLQIFTICAGTMILQGSSHLWSPRPDALSHRTLAMLIRDPVQFPCHLSNLTSTKILKPPRNSTPFSTSSPLALSSRQNRNHTTVGDTSPPHA